MTSTQDKTDKAAFLLYVFGFLLLWEWLRPLEKLTNTGNITIFLIFLITSFLLYMVRAGILLRFVVKSLYILIALHALYFEDPFFAFSWIGPFITDMILNVGRVFNADWPQLSNMFRSLLFFLLLGIMAYLLRYWLIRRRKIFIFFLMTMIYITVLDTFTPYQADWAIVRTVLAGFIIMGMLTFFRLVESSGMKKDNSYTRKWMAPLIGMIAISVTVGFAAPKAEPIWPDPVPYLKSYSENSGGGQRVGYGTDDSQLGGPFIGDDRVVFRAEVESRHYWKVETKDVYTGKGWVASESSNVQVPFSQNQVVPVSSFSEAVETVDESGTIYSYLQYPHIVYPSGIKGIIANPNISFEMDPVMEKVYSMLNSQRISLDQYSLTYEVPKYSVKALLGNGETNSVLSNDFMERYTQLPESLPARVRDLAREITTGKGTWFEQAQAIERYFDRPEYYYDKINVMIPGKDDDYVDQFLFDSKRGYCDNFSSSMVVMLRSLGIPSRWVKGYTEGEFKGLTDNSKRTFEVTNNNAHSWVEVFFPNVGWVQFEPTKGFSSNVLFNFDNDSEKPSTNETEPVVEKKEEKSETKEKTLDENKTAVSLKEIWTWIKNFVTEQLKWILFTIALVVSAIMLVYRRRSKWLPYYFVLKYKRRNKDEHFASAYLDLLKQFERNGLKRNENQTLREYARYVDKFLSSQEMSNLTSRYEQYIYKGTFQEGSWQELRELWEKLIKKTIA